MRPTAAILIVAALFAAFVATGWRTVADADRDEKVKWQLKGADRDIMKLEAQVNSLELRVKALESRP